MLYLSGYILYVIALFDLLGMKGGFSYGFYGAGPFASNMKVRAVVLAAALAQVAWGGAGGGRGRGWRTPDWREA